MQLSITKINISNQVQEGIISPNLFSNFMENLGYSADGGALAQALNNPTMERDSNLRKEQRDTYLNIGKILVEFYRAGCDPSVIPDNVLLCADTGGFGVTALDDFQAQGVPFPWAPLGLEGKVNLATGRIGGGVRLWAATGYIPDQVGDIIVTDDGPSGLRQGVFLPFQRCLSYHGHVWVRISSINPQVNGKLEIGFRRRLANADLDRKAGECLAVEVHSIQGCEWVKVPYRLKLAKGQVSQCEPVDLIIRWLPNGDQDLLVDRAMLLPDDAIDDIFDPDVVQMCKDYRATLLRWPGGNFASYYHWRDGVGPLDRRPSRPNISWGGLETNFFGTAEFIHFCRLIGAEPHITINTGTGWPEEAAAWVEYCNGAASTPMGALRLSHGDPEPYNVRFWEIGNEIYGSWQGGYHGSDENLARFNEFASAVRAVDNDLWLIANGNEIDIAERRGPRYDYTNCDSRWNLMLFEKASANMDYLALHSLPGNTSFAKKISHDEAYYALISQPVVWERIFLPELFTMAKAHLNQRGKPAKMAITEWGVLGPLENRPEVRNYGGVPYAGVFLNSMVRACEMVEITEATALLHGGAVHKAAGLVWYDPQCLVIQRYADMGNGQRVRFTLEGPKYNVENPANLGLAVEDIPYVDVVVIRPPDLPNQEIVCLVNISLDSEAPVKILVEASEIADTAWEYITYSDITAIAKPGKDERIKVITGNPNVMGSVIDLVLPICSVNWLSYRRK